MVNVERKGPSVLREALKSKKCVIGLGLFDGISAKVAASVGFDFLFAKVSQVVTQCSDLPIIADANTGFSGPLNIRRTIQFYEHAGVAGCHIEDRVFPKRCGQLKGKDVVDLQVYLERIRSAGEAHANPDSVIIARTDARNAKSLGGESASRDAFDEGVRRLKAAVAAELALNPVLINVLPDGLTGNLTTAECNELGFAAAIYPCTEFIPAMLAMQESYTRLKREGSDLRCCKGKDDCPVL
ncbi:Pyruvate/Phosphoenolpyruvate kinase-like domain-containing protein [Achaetomium macrosporum]|uniref:Pyruvate/Phosphoenolpyruvate kinase-like domain-containing protein n=1 Tax=Achaetomium macrosporum TaxID=79813 RepID=A0AAN7C5W9_9PEZI|nr:Pyruvate/Phosphoenolpyruvate kinase-like domain-containing protein [Achaetomium macrosporum]